MPYTVQYFENLLKKKRQFNMHDIAKMRQSFIRPYMIIGCIDRSYIARNIDKINKIRKRIMPHAKPIT